MEIMKKTFENLLKMTAENGGGRRPNGRRPGHLIQKLITFTTTATAAATTVAAATATTAAAPTAEITARTAVASTAAGRTFFLWTGDVDRQRATVKLRAVHGLNGLLRLFGRGVGDESEPA
jgi:hypothetical protein